MTFEVSGADRVEGLLRELAPQVIGTLVRRYGQFDLCEDAVQEALLAAAVQWPKAGIPQHPRGWLVTVASRRLTDQVRTERARRRREETVAARSPADQLVAPAPDADLPSAHDDTLTLLFLCCHPALSPASQVALTLRAVGGLTTAQVAAAFLVPEATMAQRISRAKQTIKAAGARFAPPPPQERADRLRVVLRVLYLIFNEGYAASSGPHLQRAELTAEAIRLARDLHRLLPDDGEVAGLLALMLLTDARRPARTLPDGSLVPLASQDRSRWDAAAIAEGVALVTATLARAPVGPYQLQAAIAAVHDEAARAGDTDWPQILVLYELLERLDPGPVVTLNHAVALAMCAAPGPASICSPPWTATPAWPATTAWTRSAPTCWSWPATPPPPASATGRPPAAPPACPSDATWRAGRPAWSPEPAGLARSSGPGGGVRGRPTRPRA